MQNGFVPLACLLAAISLAGLPADALERGFVAPPAEAKLRAYWWWLNGNVTEAAIRRDLREMAAKGFGGAVLVDAGGAEQRGNAQVPHGPTFASSEWRRLYRVALEEAAKQGLELSLNIQSGWNLGGLMVKASDAPKKLVWSEKVVAGGTSKPRLDEPKHDPALYGDVAVVAYPVGENYVADKRATVSHWQQKALAQPLFFSAPDTTDLVTDGPDRPGEEATRADGILDLTNRLRPDGTLDWQAPAGRWEVLRIGYTLNDHCRVSTCSEGWDGYAIDPFDRGAFDRYWKAVVDPLLADAGPYAGKTLRYLHTDSWEVEVANWTPTLFAEFRKRRGYDLRRYLPALTGRIVDSRSATNRVLNDLRRTMGDLAIDNHYRPFKDYAHKKGLLIHPESGGPHAVPIDSLQCLGYDDAPMSEFWAGSWTHRVKEEDRFFMKQPASAAHTYGRRYVLAEGFTTIGPHWQETIWDNLKPNFDKACCEGMNRLVWHAFVCSPESEGLPGQQYFAGTHLNPNVTWWNQSAPFFTYLNRCQFMLQQGQFVADALYYYGDHVPNFAQLKKSDPAKVLPGYDYDVATQEIVLRLRMRNGVLELPSGMRYRVLVLPDRDTISLPVLRHVRDLVRAGATVVGGRPRAATAYDATGAADREVKEIAAELWGEGRVRATTGREALRSQGVLPDCESSGETELDLDYIHRRAGGDEIYFVANRTGKAGARDLTFRVSGSVPELWDPITGERRALTDWVTINGRAIIPLWFEAYGSWFVVFRKPGTAPSWGPANFPRQEAIATISGPWQVSFDPKWGGPAQTEFPALTDWSQSENLAIRHYAGSATYETEFTVGASRGQQVWLDLGTVREIAEVTLNGKSLGTFWSTPFRVDVTNAIHPGANQLQVRVTNFWPNRIIGDAIEGTRFTKTNVRQLTAKSALMPSGLLGPVRILISK